MDRNNFLRNSTADTRLGTMQTWKMEWSESTSNQKLLLSGWLKVIYSIVFGSLWFDSIISCKIPDSKLQFQFREFNSIVEKVEIARQKRGQFTQGGHLSFFYWRLWVFSFWRCQSQYVSPHPYLISSWNSIDYSNYATNNKLNLIVCCCLLTSYGPIVMMTSRKAI